MKEPLESQNGYTKLPGETGQAPPPTRPLTSTSGQTRLVEVKSASIMIVIPDDDTCIIHTFCASAVLPTLDIGLSDSDGIQFIGIAVGFRDIVNSVILGYKPSPTIFPARRQRQVVISDR